MDAVLFHNCILEFLGTLVMILLGDGVCACMGLNKSKGKGGGWVVITLGWGLAVMAGVFIAHNSGAHLNPAVSVGLACAGMFPWSNVIPYVIAQMLGAFLGAALVWLMYKDHFDATDDPEGKLTIFCTMPAIENKPLNFLQEFICAFILLLLIVCISSYTGVVGLGGNSAWPITMVIVSIGMSLGGVTGYAMNPARDLGPRIAHALLPIKGKRDSGWSYSWVPILGPLAGGALAGLLGVWITSF